jgi:hypothetical protein
MNSFCYLMINPIAYFIKKYSIRYKKIGHSKNECPINLSCFLIESNYFAAAGSGGVSGAGATGAPSGAGAGATGASTLGASAGAGSSTFLQPTAVIDKEATKSMATQMDNIFFISS